MQQPAHILQEPFQTFDSIQTLWNWYKALTTRRYHLWLCWLRIDKNTGDVFLQIVKSNNIGVAKNEIIAIVWDIKMNLWLNLEIVIIHHDTENLREIHMKFHLIKLSCNM